MPKVELTDREHGAIIMGRQIDDWAAKRKESIIEQDALKSLPETPPIRDHPHEEIKSFIATPRFDEGLMQKARAWITGNQGSSSPIVYKSSDGLRYMFLITSNSYQDREGETITSKALEEYEASCYPGEGLFHCDNAFQWWHDDEAVMGTIEAVEYIEPFLVEIAKEIPNDPLSKILWDFAEKNGDNAGTSHRFGYREQDRDEDGTYHRIFKQETSYLPERALAANERTYAGVLGTMTIPESRKRLGQIVEDATGIKELTDLIHTDLGEAKKRLAEMNIQHKAAFPPAAAKKPAPTDTPPPAQAPAANAAAPDEAADQAEDMSETKAEPPLEVMMNLVNLIYSAFQDMMDSQMGLMDNQMLLGKAFKEYQESAEAKLVSEKSVNQSLQEKMSFLEKTLDVIQKRIDLKPRSVTLDKGGTPESIKTAVDVAEQARIKGELVNDPFWGELKPLPKG